MPKRFTLEERIKKARKNYDAALKAHARMRGFDQWSFEHSLDALRLHLIKLEKRAGVYDGSLTLPSYRYTGDN